MTSNERRASIVTLLAQLGELRELVRLGHEDGSLTVAQDASATEKAAELNRQLQTTITEGAVFCPTCESPPHGLAHESATGKGQPFRYLYEVGCPHAGCRDHRATDLLPELAVERWNAGDYDAPRTGPAEAPSA